MLPIRQNYLQINAGTCNPARALNRCNQTASREAALPAVADDSAQKVRAMLARRAGLTFDELAVRAPA